MTQTVQEKWEQKWANADLNTPANPCFVLRNHSHLLPFRGLGLEVACGLGGNARFLAQCGLKVEAWDISDNALTVLNNYASAMHLPIQPTIADIEQMLLPYQKYDVIVVSRYLQRDLFKQLESALKPNGLLIYQTFLAPVQDHAPSNPAFYLQTGELVKSCPNLRTEVYGEGWLFSENDVEQSGEKHRYAWFIGRKLK